MMSRKKNNKGPFLANIHPDIKKSVWVIIFLAAATLFILAAINQAGPVGAFLYKFFQKLFGWGYYLFPVITFLLALSLIATEKTKIFGITLASSILFLVSGLGFIDIISPGKGGLTGAIVGSLKTPFGTTASLVITLTFLIISFLVILNRPFKMSLPRFQKSGAAIKEPEINLPPGPPPTEEESPKVEAPTKTAQEKPSFTEGET